MDPAITGLIILLSAAWGWNWSSRANERAAVIARAACEELSYQYLDDTVVLNRLRFSSDSNGLHTIRLYRFEYAIDGRARHLGEIEFRRDMPNWIRLLNPEGVIHLDLNRFGRHQ